MLWGKLDGKTQVIVRFISYRTRARVYSAKKYLKGDPEKIFITENLTQHRTDLVRACLEFKLSNDIYTFWTTDGRIYVKNFEHSHKELIRNRDEILDIARRGSTNDQSSGNPSNHEPQVDMNDHADQNETLYY